MIDPVLKFEQIKRNNSLWSDILFREKYPWTKKIVLLFILPIFFLFFPFIAWKSKYLLWNRKVKKLMRKNKNLEAFSFGVDNLSAWSESESDLRAKGDWPPFQSAWWMTFSSLCNCALVIGTPNILGKLEQVFEKRPDGNSGYSVSEGYCELARVAWSEGDKEKVWSYTNKAIVCDETYGYPYFLRAWFGENLGLGQPVEDLVLAIRHQAELMDQAFKDQLFIRNPNLMENLRTSLVKNGLL